MHFEFSSTLLCPRILYIQRLLSRRIESLHRRSLQPSAPFQTDPALLESLCQAASSKQLAIYSIRACSSLLCYALLASDGHVNSCTSLRLHPTNAAAASMPPKAHEVRDVESLSFLRPSYVLLLLIGRPSRMNEHPGRRWCPSGLIRN